MSRSSEGHPSGRNAAPFRIGRVRIFLRGRVWYLCYHEQGRRCQPRVGPDRDVARQMAAKNQRSVGDWCSFCTWIRARVHRRPSRTMVGPSRACATIFVADNPPLSSRNRTLDWLHFKRPLTQAGVRLPADSRRGDCSLSTRPESCAEWPLQLCKTESPRQGYHDHRP